MHRYRARAKAHRLLCEWGDMVRQEALKSSGYAKTLGYASRSTEGRMIANGGVISGGNPGCIVPNVVFKGQSALIGGIVADMPAKMKSVCEAAYAWEGDTMAIRGKQWCAQNQLSYPRFEFYVGKVKDFVADMLAL